MLFFYLAVSVNGIFNSYNMSLINYVIRLLFLQGENVMIYILYIYSLSLYIFTNNVIIPMVVCRLIFMTPVLSTLWYHWFQFLI